MKKVANFTVNSYRLFGILHLPFSKMQKIKYKNPFLSNSYLVEAGELFLLVLQDLECLLEPAGEGGHLAPELDHLLVGGGEALHQLLRAHHHVLVTALQHHPGIECSA
jgi:hypothetical protein